MASVQGGSRHHECALCMETFTSPRLLPCFHTFCVGCLQRLVQTQPRSGTFPCPTCRSTTPIPQGGVGKFQVNFYIEAEVEGQRPGSTVSVRACEICKKNSATHKCTDCDQFACDTCTAIHASFAATKSHTILQLKNLKIVKGSGQSHVKITKERYCALHTEEKIRFFCNQCSTTICRDCKLTSHEGHATTDLSAKSKKAKQLIVQVTTASRKKLEPKLRQQLKEADQHQKKAQIKKKELLALLERRAAELKQEIDKSLLQAKQELDQEANSVKKTVAACIDSMNMELAGFLSLTEHAGRVAEGGCEADILEMPKLLHQFFGGKMTPHSQKLPMNYPLYASGGVKAVCKLEGKLKSFTDCEWKAFVQMEDETTKCISCHHRYGRMLPNCPKCRRASNIQSGYFGYGGSYVGNKQCSNCRHMYAQNYQNCPSCEAAVSDNIKATIQTAIPEFIGRVVRSEAEEEENKDTCDDEWDPYGEQDSYDDEWDPYGEQNTGFYQRNPYAVQAVKETKASLTSQIIQEIDAIQSCLSQWKG